jgi:hypothetical protein
MIIHEENLHRVFIGEFLSFIKKNEDMINEVIFGEDIHALIVVDMKDGDFHGFELKSELYITVPSLWGGNMNMIPFRGICWTDMLFTRIVCPKIKITFHPFSDTTAEIHQLPYWVKKTEEAKTLFFFADNLGIPVTLFSEVRDMLITATDPKIINRILDVIYREEVVKYMEPCFTHVDVHPRTQYLIGRGSSSVAIKYAISKVINPLIDAMYSIDQKYITPDCRNRLKNEIDREIGVTEDLETRMFLMRWKMEHYGPDESTEMRL